MPDLTPQERSEQERQAYIAHAATTPRRRDVLSEPADRFAAERAKGRKRGVVMMPGHPPQRWHEAAGVLAAEYGRLAELEEEVVRVGRVSGASWETIAVHMGGYRTGSALLKKYGAAPWSRR